MAFNVNSVENYIIKQLTGVNLNRSVNEVLLETNLEAALIRLNPE